MRQSPTTLGIHGTRIAEPAVRRVLVPPARKPGSGGLCLLGSDSGRVRLPLVTGESYNASPDRDDLGELLVLLHGADVPANTIQVAYRVWRHQERLHAAFRADAEEQQRRGASKRTFSLGRETPQPTEIEETVRIWRDGNRVRAEYHGGERDGYYAVADGPLWWMWDERNGAHSNQDDPSVGSGVGEELQIMRNPTPSLSSLRFKPTGSSEVAGWTDRRSSWRPRSGSATTGTTRRSTASRRAPGSWRRADRPSDPAPGAAFGVRPDPRGLPCAGDAPR